MEEQAIIVFSPHCGFAVAQHSSGYFVVEFVEDDTGIGCGDTIHASEWRAIGVRTISCRNVEHYAEFWGPYGQLEEAKKRALKFVSDLNELRSGAIS